MITLAFILAFVSVALEMFLVIQFNWVRRFMLRFEKVGLILSFLLSVGMGILFGAEGLIALIGGLGSTLITAVIYNTHALTLVDKWRAIPQEVKLKKREETIQMSKDFIRVTKGFIRLVTAPLRLWRRIKIRWKKVASAASQRWSAANNVWKKMLLRRA